MDSIKEKADVIFLKLFPEFKCGEPYRHGDMLYIPFTYFLHMPLSGVIAYEVLQCSNLYVAFDPFLSKPQHCVKGGIDWIQMKYIDKIQEFDVFAAAISVILST